MIKKVWLPIGFFLGFLSCKKEQEQTQVKVETITESVYASGIVKSKNQYQVFSTANGLIQSLYVSEGDRVKVGDPLFQVLNKTAQLNTENARLAADYADLTANSDKLNELKINIDMAKSKKASDSLLLERQRNLWVQQIGSKNEFEQRELAYKNSTTAYNALLLRYNDLKRQLDFADKQSKKALQISSTITGDYIIRSDISGKVYSLLKEKGEMVNTQSVVALLGDANDFILELQIDEYDIAKIKVGQKIFLNMDSYKGQVFEAKVDKINPIMNERTKSFTLEARFITKPETLYPNLTTEANIVIRTKENALTIPRDYFIDDAFILTKNNQKIKVETGLKDYQKIEILRGVSANDIIYKPAK
jgi:HlyD family secretion protein